ncbi:MAG: hypothetical protein JXB48_03235 [Candidatus Latescibacteria bacterium]|nr:hypothetical protein [Candidatus Latescibacterota bacterium]
MKTRISIFAFGLFCILIGCSGDNSVNDDQHSINARPSVPEPKSYAGMVPAKSDELIVETVPLSDYSPFVIGATLKDGYKGSYIDSGGGSYSFEYFADQLYTEMVWGFSPKAGIRTDRYNLLKNDKVINNPMIDFMSWDLNDWWLQLPCKPLSNKPYLQLVRFWKRIGDVERYSGSTSKTTTRSTTHGTTETSASEFSKTLGIEASVSGSWYVDFEVKVKTEFSWTESHETSIMQEETFEESFTISCPENRNIVYCVWQLIEEYRIVGADGKLFIDPNFLFDDTYHVAICPTRELVPMTTYFNN